MEPIQKELAKEMVMVVEKGSEKAIERADSTSSVESIEYPDGGLRAWLIVCGSMCCTFSTFGFVNAWGSYYETDILKDTPASNISAAFTIWCFVGFMCFLGIYTVLTFIDVSAIRAGVSPDFSFYLLSIANASSGIGRILTGLLCDRVGAINVIAPMSLAAAIMTFAWPYARSQGSLIAVAILYGFASSSFVSAFNMPVYSMGEMGDVGRRLGTVMVFTAVGALCGPPISGAINTTTGNFDAVSYYAVQWEKADAVYSFRFGPRPGINVMTHCF
ncbi:hypothetical protein NLJ89_g3694 [Agrocybe chaxingu]|uniref:Major facilitator superfamily (MFS) profile domain-containing protein n=1 Tax=Agrocybe chaxingu TaxID=84603 RepID=A0A9W8KAQ2_9AGAR|nr:hypothetical protein NLJ89_g3694 [Agrocybe chaxingu]